jgi:hypothetical protein
LKKIFKKEKIKTEKNKKESIYTGGRSGTGKKQRNK